MVLTAFASSDSTENMNGNFGISSFNKKLARLTIFIFGGKSSKKISLLRLENKRLSVIVCIYLFYIFRRIECLKFSKFIIL
jgi:hypothetical protein